MKGLRSSGDSGQATSHLGHLNLNHRATTIIGQAGHTAGQVAHGPAGTPHAGDGDLINSADDQLKTQGTKTAKAASRSVKGTTKTLGKQTVKASQKGARRIAEATRQTAETVRGAGRAAGGPAMGTRAVKGGVVAATRRAALRMKGRGAVEPMRTDCRKMIRPCHSNRRAPPGRAYMRRPAPLRPSWTGAA